jgi:hypothetical protein
MTYKTSSQSDPGDLALPIQFVVRLKRTLDRFLIAAKSSEPFRRVHDVQPLRDGPGD